MPVCFIKQDEIYNSANVDDNLAVSTAPSSDNLEEDLNYIRSAIRRIVGVIDLNSGLQPWYILPSNYDLSTVFRRLNTFLDDFEVQHYSTEEGAGSNVGKHKNITATGSLDVGGTSLLRGNATLQQNLSVLGTASVAGTLGVTDEASFSAGISLSASSINRMRGSHSYHVNSYLVYRNSNDYGSIYLKDYESKKFFTIQTGLTSSHGLVIENLNGTTLSHTAEFRGDRVTLYRPTSILGGGRSIGDFAVQGNFFNTGSVALSPNNGLAWVNNTLEVARIYAINESVYLEFGNDFGDVFDVRQINGPTTRTVFRFGGGLEAFVPLTVQHTLNVPCFTQDFTNEDPNVPPAVTYSAPSSATVPALVGQAPSSVILNPVSTSGVSPKAHYV